MLASAVITAVAFATIVIVTFVLANQNKDTRIGAEKNIRNVVDQVNTSQQYSYEFDKRQQQQLTSLQKNVEDVRDTYVKKSVMAENVETKNLKATNISSSGQMELSGDDWGKGAIQFNSTQTDASNSRDYLIQRGGPGKPEWKNQIVIKTPLEKDAGVNIMSSDGQSRLFVDSTTGQVNVPGNLKANTLQIGDKWRVSGVGDSQDDTWLRFFDKDGNDFYGGVAAGSIWTRDNAFLNGNTIITGETEVQGPISLTGGTSEFNPNKEQTIFASKVDGKNYIRGDTDIYGNIKIYGNTNYDGDFKVGKNMDVTGSTTLNKTVKINHNLQDWANEAPISAYGEPGQTGASFGSKGWSHFPWKDGSTYIRPGQNNKSVNIGDWGASSVNIGRGDTSVVINGYLVSKNPNWNWFNAYRSDSDQLLFGGDANNRGIWSGGDRDFSIYTSGQKRFSVNKDGVVFNRNDVVVPSVGRDTNDNDWFRINPRNANNKNSPGTAVYQGMALNDGGGLAVGNWWKVPEGQANIRDALKVRNSFAGDWTDKAAITTWTPNNTFAGAAFGGPNNWSYFPHFDGNTYVRPGVTDGAVMIGDSGTKNVQIGTQDGQSVNRIGSASYIPYSDGHTYIRPGRDGQNIYIGDDWAKEVNLGKSDGNGSVISRPWRTNVRRHIDAWDNWNNSGKTLFAGWNGDKVILGNNTTAGQDYVNNLPKNVVASANNLYVYGNSTATNNLCVNNTCLSEGDLQKIKSWL